MLYTDDLADFLRKRGITVPIHRQGDVPDFPDEVVILDGTPGLSDSYDGLMERPSVRARIRGKQSHAQSAEALAGAVHTAFVDAPVPISIGGRHVTQIQSFGGPPALLGLDDPSSRRVILQATYVLEIER